MKQLYPILLAMLFLVGLKSVNAQFAGGDGTSSNPYQIATVEQLQLMKNNDTAHYRMVNDIDASATSTWNDGAGFEPIGFISGNNFTGSLRGGGFVISNLYFNYPQDNYIGLFSSLSGEVDSLGITDANMIGESYVGGLAGIVQNGCKVSNCFVSGNVAGDNYIGLLIGYAYTSNIECCYTEGEATADNFNAGGLVSYTKGATLKKCFSIAKVKGTYNVGGLIGTAWDGTVSNCYAAGTVEGQESVGGFINWIRGTTVSNCYSTARVSGDANVGGFSGFRNASVTSCYWDSVASGIDSSTTAEVKSTSEMLTEANYTGWDFTSTWIISEGNGYPTFTWYNASPIINYTTGGNGALTGTLIQTVDVAANSSPVEADPNSGYLFLKWSDDLIENPRVDYNVHKAFDVEAIFTQACTLSYGASSGGTIRGVLDTVLAATLDGPAITVMPDAGYSFIGWSDGSRENPRIDNNITGNIAVTAQFVPNSWNGSGTEVDPYQVTTLDELQSMVNYPGKHYALMNNIDASATS
ncbi:MAG: hypothetical protein MI922_04740, partial [Bacteroidales bacterium]|nr:hypothetical protein [Bacteroidales bacterium]